MCVYFLVCLWQATYFLNSVVWLYGENPTILNCSSVNGNDKNQTDWEENEFRALAIVKTFDLIKKPNCKKPWTESYSNERKLLSACVPCLLNAQLTTFNTFVGVSFHYFDATWFLGTANTKTPFTIDNAKIDILGKYTKWDAHVSVGLSHEYPVVRVIDV